MPAGRPRKPTAILRLQGTDQPCRHAERDHEPHSNGTPKPPSWLKGEAAKFWRRNVPLLETMGVAEAIDTESLAALCQAWANWRKEQLRYERGKGHIYCVSSALKAWCSIASKYGFSPSDRAKLATANPDEEADPLVELMKARGRG